MGNEVNGPFLVVAVAVAMAIVLWLRRVAPRRYWLGMTLAILFGPGGHLYLKGAAKYVLLMYIAWAGLLIFTPLPPQISVLLLTVLSGLLMNARMRSPQEGDGTSEQKNGRV